MSAFVSIASEVGMAVSRVLDLGQESDGVDWVVRLGIAILFGLMGWDKFDRQTTWIHIFQQIGFGDWFRYFTGVVEVLGAALVVIPYTVTLGLGLLVVTMIGAALAHILYVHDGAVTAVPIVLATGMTAFGVLRRRL